MIKDRGSKKWTAMMLTEHIVEIKKWNQEQYHVKKRELTEWEFEEIEQIIQQSYRTKALICITIWKQNKLHDIVGVITGADTINKELLIETETSIKRISFNEIQKANLVNTDD